MTERVDNYGFVIKEPIKEESAVEKYREFVGKRRRWGDQDMTVLDATILELDERLKKLEEK